MKRKFFAFVVPLILGLIIGCFCGNIFIASSQAGDLSSAYGAVIESTSVQSVFTINSGVSGSLINDGSAVVYFNWTAGTVVADTGAADNKCYLNVGDSIHVPGKVKRFTHATSVGTAKLRYIAD